jgi:hypothetical protein
LTIAADATRRAAAMIEGQGPSALIGLIAIAVIVAVNVVARPDFSRSDGRAMDACDSCGTVVAVRRSAHSEPVTWVDVRMPDGSLRTLRGPTPGLSVGDVVEVRGEAISPRDVY